MATEEISSVAPAEISSVGVDVLCVAVVVIPIWVLHFYQPRLGCMGLSFLSVHVGCRLAILHSITIYDNFLLSTIQGHDHDHDVDVDVDHIVLH